MIDRTITPVLLDLFTQYPVVTLTGPRQAGKTTLCRAAFPHLRYYNLERPDVRDHAIDDPLGFLRTCAGGAVLDEIQHVPDLVSYIQADVDERGSNGLYVLTGSQQLRVTAAISQSLAGRTAILQLLPFSIAEVADPQSPVDAMIHTGFYPRIHDRDLDATRALGDYFETYVERDVRQVSAIRNLTAFRRFMRLCAGRVGQLLNLHSLGADAGVSHTTARQWLSVLEASYVVFLLEPLHANLSKRLVKSPKLYFFDVGLASHLLGIEYHRQVATHPLRGQLFENLVIVEALKHRFNRGQRSNLNFYRDSAGTEVDLVYGLADRQLHVEIKAGETVSRSFLTGLRKLRPLFGERIAGEILVHGREAETERDGVQVTGPVGFVPVLAGLEMEALNRNG